MGILPIFTTRKQSLGQGNILAPVYHSVHRGGSTWAGTLEVGKHPWAGTPPGQVHPSPPGRYTPWAGTPHSRYTPQQCMLGYGQQAGDTHPTGMHSCFYIAIAKSSE